MSTPHNNSRQSWEISGNYHLVIQMNLALGAAFLAYMVLFALVFGIQGKPVTILFVATAAMNAGAFLGFLYSTFGEEKERFSQVFVGLNGLLGGATLADLLKPDSTILKCLRKLTLGCGLQATDAGAVVAVVVTCLPLGFFWLYMNRKLVLNPETARIDDLTQRYAEARKAIARKPPPTVNENGGATSDEEVTAAANVLIKRPDAGKTGTTGTLLADAQSYYALGKHQEAIAAFQKVLEQRPNQPEAMLYLASSLVETKKHIEAADILEKLILLPSAPVKAWKLLGYAYLFYPDDRPDKAAKLQRAIVVLEKYVSFEPKDSGAQLNLACAYGQLGPESPGAKEKVIELIRDIVQSSPETVSRISPLTEQGQDFERWTGVQEFMELIGK